MAEEDLDGPDVGSAGDPGRGAGMPENVTPHRMAQELGGALFAHRVDCADAQGHVCTAVEMLHSPDGGEISGEKLELAPVGGKSGHEPAGDRDGADPVTLADKAAPGGAGLKLKSGCTDVGDLGATHSEGCQAVDDQGVAVLEGCRVRGLPGVKNAKSAGGNAVENTVGSLWRTLWKTLWKHDQDLFSNDREGWCGKACENAVENAVEKLWKTLWKTLWKHYQDLFFADSPHFSPCNSHFFHRPLGA